MIGATLVGAAILCAAPLSLHQSQDKGLSLSPDGADARVGRPLTASQASPASIKARHAAGGAALRGGRHLLTIAEGCVRRPSSSFGATAIKVRVTNFSGKIA